MELVEKMRRWILANYLVNAHSYIYSFWQRTQNLSRSTVTICKYQNTQFSQYGIQKKIQIPDSTN
jgi:hypothetical protein